MSSNCHSFNIILTLRCRSRGSWDWKNVLSQNVFSGINFFINVTYFGNISLQKVATGTKYDVINDMNPSHFEIDWCKVFFNLFGAKALKKLLRWLDWIFWGGYLPSLSVWGYYDVIVVLIGWPELERRSLAVSFDEAFWLVAVFLWLCN